jgi:hypothetical protein
MFRIVKQSYIDEMNRRLDYQTDWRYFYERKTHELSDEVDKLTAYYEKEIKKLREDNAQAVRRGAEV